MSDGNAQIDRVVAQIDAIVDSGNVWNRKRLATTTDEFRDIAGAVLLDGIRHLRVWFVSEAELDATVDGGGTEQWNRVLEIEGFLELNDPTSEPGARTLVESIVRTLGHDLWSTRLNGTALYGQPPRLIEFRPVIFGFVTCHHVVLRMPVSTISD